MKRIAALLISLAVLATACQGNVFSLTVGDCFNDPDNLAEVSDVEIVACTETHDNEVYAAYEIPGETFPGRTGVQTDASENCLARFDPYVGRDYQSSKFEISALTPTDQSWDQGDHEVVCFLFAFDGSKLNAAAKDSGL